MFRSIFATTISPGEYLPQNSVPPGEYLHQNASGLGHNLIRNTFKSWHNLVRNLFGPKIFCFTFVFVFVFFKFFWKSWKKPAQKLTTVSKTSAVNNDSCKWDSSQKALFLTVFTSSWEKSDKNGLKQQNQGKKWLKFWF